MPVNTSITFRKGSSSQWSTTNPVLASGEPGYDLTNNILKIGDGVSAWNSLSNHIHSVSDIANFNSSVSGLVSGIYAPLSGKLNQFASTSSAELASTINDETGSGLLVFNTSPSFSGVPTVPTASTGTNTTQIASTAFVRGEISNLVGSAPSTLDTLNELATALGNDANFSTTVTNSLAGKSNLSGASFTGAISGPSGDFTVLRQNGVSVQPLLTNPVTGTGTSGYLSKWTGSNTVSSGIIFDNGSRISIGTTTPSGILHIVENSSSPSYSYFENSNSLGIRAGIALVTNYVGTKYSGIIENDWLGNGFVFKASRDLTNSQGGFVFQGNDGTTRMVIRTNSNGNIGIGTTAPAYKLDVIGNVRSSGNHIITGNVGIGTTTPSGSLDIAGDVYVRGTANNFGTIYLKSSAVADNILKLRADQFGSLFLEAGSSPYLKLGNQDGIADLRAGASQLTIGHSYNRGGANAASQYISFNPANIERVRITHAGDFGIGTTTPSGQLHVVGTGIVSSRLGIGNTNPQYTLDVSGSGNFNNLAISGTPIAEVIDDEVANLLVAGSGITLSYNDNANTLTVDANVSTSLVAGTGISLVYNVSTDELSINTSGVSLVGHTHSHSDISNVLTTLSQFTTSQNDLNLGSGGIIRISSSGTLNITGFVATIGGDARLLSNVGSNTITLKHNDSGSSANNRIYCVGSADFEIETNGSAAIYYDNIDNKWRVG